eukprot:GGOE01009616.1.p2 GENE.GGOE01009616.1~~GGOE01009616.1.p2  ORF type:complete len:317 (-),score=42.28 GGOE01009616.1:675-1595(-)
MAHSPVAQPTGVAFTHNPYWYEGFDPSALRATSTTSTSTFERPPFPWSQYHWPTNVVRTPLRSLRMTKFGGETFGKPTSQAFDSNSDRTVGYSDSGSDKGSEERQLEAQLVQCIIEYFGDCKGSLPSERVQNVIKKDFAELYEQVVVARFRKKWHKFLQHCSDTFHLFTRPAQPEPNQDYCWRIRLVNNSDWEEADVQEEELRAQRDKELLDKVHSILNSVPNKECPMIEVINELNKDVKGEEAGKDDNEDFELHNRKGRKIRAGDLKRLMRKCNSNFTIIEYQEGEGQKRATHMKLLEQNPKNIM